MKYFIVFFILPSFILSFQKDDILQRKNFIIVGLFECSRDDYFAAKIVLKQNFMNIFNLNNVEKYILVNQTFSFTFNSTFITNYNLEIYDRCHVPCDNCEFKTLYKLEDAEELKSKTHSTFYKRIMINSYEMLHLGKNMDGKDSELICNNKDGTLHKFSLSDYINTKNNKNVFIDLSNFECLSF
uniref:Uncharacterized protein n=1 Tax=Strongyloides stercoralis TaxID=6248 RepID=A0A0K0EM07_STRER